MQTWYYEVVSIDGDYANLRRIDIPSDDLKLVARALLAGRNLRWMQTEIRDVPVRTDGAVKTSDLWGSLSPGVEKSTSGVVFYLWGSLFIV